MKTMMLLSVLLLTSSAAAFAGGNEGPAGSPYHPDPVIAQVIDHGPVVPMRLKKTLEIHAGGRVVFYDEQAPEADEGTLIATLSTEKMEKVKAEIAQIPAGELGDLDSGKGRCLGAGPVDYSVQRQGTMELAIFATNSMCHRFRLPDEPGQSVIELLSSLLQIARL